MRTCISKGHAALIATVPVGAGTVGHCTRFFLGASSELRQQLQHSSENQECPTFFWLPRLGPNRQGEALGIFPRALLHNRSFFYVASDFHHLSDWLFVDFGVNSGLVPPQGTLGIKSWSLAAPDQQKYRILKIFDIEEVSFCKLFLKPFLERLQDQSGIQYLMKSFVFEDRGCLETIANIMRS